MTTNQRTVVFGFAGARVEVRDFFPEETVYQPNSELCQLLKVDQYHLLCQKEFLAVSEQIKKLINVRSPHTEVVIETLDIQDAWDLNQVYTALAGFAARYEFDEGRDAYFVHFTRGSFIMQICLFALTEARRFPAVLLHNKPPTSERPNGQLLRVDLTLPMYAPIAERFTSPPEIGAAKLKAGINTKNVRFNTLIEEVERVAVNTSEPILLLGPTGCGKSELARRIYELRKERCVISGKFVALDCGTILRDETAHSQLFGHKKGAFTGAIQDRDGLIKTADGGVLFLDEIGNLPMTLQPLLLGALERKTFRPFGADGEQSSEFQLIAATNCDLRVAVREQKFREDLLARIDLFTYEMPGLCDRREDIEPNLDYEIVRWKNQHKSKLSIDKQAPCVL